jgi:PAS domain S-box-containing protein
VKRYGYEMKISHKITSCIAASTGILCVFTILIYNRHISATLIIPAILITNGILGYILMRTISNPVEKLCQKADILSTNNPEFPIEISEQNEFGYISRNLDRMSRDLNKASSNLADLCKEITERKEIEEELMEREEHFQKLFENANHAVFIYNFEGTLLNVNDMACSLLGFEKTNLIGTNYYGLFPGQEAAKPRYASRTGRDSCSLRYESQFLRADGTRVDVEISSSVVDLKKGTIQSIVTDITERKEIEKALKKSEEKFRTFMETASDLMFITDAECRLIYTNPAMIQTLYYSEGELKGFPFSKLFSSAKVEKWDINTIRNLVEEDKPCEIIWQTQDGRSIAGELSLTGIYDGSGQFKGIRGVFRDISQRKLIENSQRLSQLGMLSADVAHEIKNQLTAILSLAQIMLLEKMDSAEIMEHLQLIVDKCGHMNDVVRRLLMFSKPSTHNYKKTDIHSTIDLVLKLVEKSFEKDKIKIIRQYDSKLPYIRIDEKHMHEVFMNILQNASEAMENGGEISILTRQVDSSIAIDFQDTGTGIDEKVLQKIYDPFFTTKENGTGLGVSACYGILKAHGGDLHYSSIPGQGTTATVTLPIPN